MDKKNKKHEVEIEIDGSVILVVVIAGVTAFIVVAEIINMILEKF